MWKIATLTLLAAVMASSLSKAQERRRYLVRPSGIEKSFEHDGKERTYRIHVPDGVGTEKPAPLLVVFHGGGGNSKQSSKMGFTDLADREGIIVLYPEGEDGHWADGRDDGVVAEKVAGNDDVGFVTALIASTADEFKVDPARIYATGFSNGGMMSHRMGIEKADLFAAIAPSIGGIPSAMATPEKFRPSGPVSVLIIQGTEDPLVPYHGGEVAKNQLGGKRGRGEVISTTAAVELWSKANGCRGAAVVRELPDIDPKDGCKLVEHTYPEGKNGARVKLIVMEGAGHTILGGAQYLPERIIGKTCRDADAVELIWDFFKSLP